MGMTSAYAAAMSPATVIIALGSNRCSRYGRPADAIHAAIAALGKAGLKADRVSQVHATSALGPSGRDYANAVMTTQSRLSPPQILAIIKRIERSLGRRGARRWGARLIDLDLIAWGERAWPSPLLWRRAQRLAVPHKAMHHRRFVLEPLLEIAPQWRHPVLRLTTRQMLARLNARR